MTEIPEHLLKRSQAAKSKATGEAAPAESAPAAAATPAKAESAAPAVAKAATPAPAAAPVAKPDPPYVAAAKSRKKIPFWAMATLAILPLWAFMYVRAMTPGAAEAATPLSNGAATYTAAACSGCHGAAGEGGAGYPFANGEVLKTYPHIEDQLRWVYNGSGAYVTAGVQISGDPNRDGGAHISGARAGANAMPAFGKDAGGSLTEVQILEVVCEERYGLGGGDETSEEFTKWCSPTSEIWLGLEAGTLTFDNMADTITGIFPVGTTPAAGHSADEQP